MSLTSFFSCVLTLAGKTFQVEKGEPLEVTWENKIPLEPDYLLTSRAGVSVVDTTLHWAYSLTHPKNYTQYSIANNGVPLVPHLHGGRTNFRFDGNPEFFFSPNQEIQGPRYVTNEYTYENDQPAGFLWIHGTQTILHVIQLSRFHHSTCTHTIFISIEQQTIVSV